jgi:hypothetical protein
VAVEAAVDKDTKTPQVVCKFEELKGQFLVRREIGRGKKSLAT